MQKVMFMLDSKVNGSIFKIDELRDIKNHKMSAILGIRESKLDSSFTDTEININDTVELGMIEIEMMKVFYII